MWVNLSEFIHIYNVAVKETGRLSCKQPAWNELLKCNQIPVKRLLPSFINSLRELVLKATVQQGLVIFQRRLFKRDLGKQENLRRPLLSLRLFGEACLASERLIMDAEAAPKLLTLRNTDYIRSSELAFF